MRISEIQRQCIKEAVEHQFGADARVLLFGSRVDDTARGGDIDLLVETNSMVPDSVEAVAAKLQDSMATRLLPSLDTLIRADDSPRPFLDILAELEKFGFVPQETDWQFFRSLRNNLAHDYPERTAQTVATLNLLFSEWRHFAAILSRAADYYARLA